ncbi:hypothetical protein ISN45_Aa04g007710, partial [Arabidopsis thaliana x Arabidopsis arenosa]
MKLNNQKDTSEKLMWAHNLSGSGSPIRPVSKLMVRLLLLVSVSNVVYTLKLISNCCNQKLHLSISFITPTSVAARGSSTVVSGITGLGRLWKQKKTYINT